MVKRKNKRQKLTRKLSNHVVTRWYRAPEIILDEADYDNKIDIWSLGCVLGELLRTGSKKSEKWSDREQRVIFPGSSAFPNSPCKEGKTKESDDKSIIISSKDQLLLILKIVGPCNQDQMSFITKDSSFAYMNCLH